jgi:serine/threonine-protein kinase RsbW
VSPKRDGPDRARSRMEKSFKRTFDSLADIFAFTESFFDAESVGAAQRHDVNFAVEELFTNMVKYNSTGSSDIRLEIHRRDGRLVVSLIDADAKPFDVTRSPPVDIHRPIEERQPGGLGLHLTKKIVDSIDYRHVDGCTTIKFSKNLR